MGLWSLQRHVIPQTPWLVLVGHTARCGSDDDVAEAEAAFERLAAAPADESQTALRRQQLSRSQLDAARWMTEKGGELTCPINHYRRDGKQRQ